MDNLNTHAKNSVVDLLGPKAGEPHAKLATELRNLASVRLETTVRHSGQGVSSLTDS